MTLIAFSLSVMAINGAEKSDGIDAFPYRDLIEKYVASSDFDKQKDIVIATRLLSKFSKYPYLNLERSHKRTCHILGKNCQNRHLTLTASE